MRLALLLCILALSIASVSAQPPFRMPFQMPRQNRAMMCGAKAIDRTRFVCCGTQALQLPQQVPWQFADCCEQEVIDTRREKCCKHGTNEEKVDASQQGCCGSDTYDLQGGESCCSFPARNFYKVIEQNELCCGPRVVDAQYHVCCQGNINKVQSDPRRYVCCGTKAVESRRYECCGQKPIRRDSRSSKCCNGTAYSTRRSERCCRKSWDTTAVAVFRGGCPNVDPPTTAPPTTRPPPTTQPPTKPPKTQAPTTKSPKNVGRPGGTGAGQVNVVIHPGLPGMPNGINLGHPMFNHPLFQQPGMRFPNAGQRMWFPYPGLIPGYPQQKPGQMPNIFPGMPFPNFNMPPRQGQQQPPNNPRAMPFPGFPWRMPHTTPQPGTAQPLPFPGFPNQRRAPGNPADMPNMPFPGFPHMRMPRPGNPNARPANPTRPNPVPQFPGMPQGPRAPGAPNPGMPGPKQGAGQFQPGPRHPSPPYQPFPGMPGSAPTQTPRGPAGNFPGNNNPRNPAPVPPNYNYGQVDPQQPIPTKPPKPTQPQRPALPANWQQILFPGFPGNGQGGPPFYGR